MNKKILLLLIVFIAFCYMQQKNEVVKKEDEIKSQLVELAKSYQGVSYRAGGRSRKGMDCSGLVTTVFENFDMKLPRSSALMSTVGHRIELSKVKKGDLLFFDITNLKGKINHVGIVTYVSNMEVLFIHATTSKGVIVSSMNELYWKEEFVLAKRVL